ncbi:MAG: Fe-S-binding domain-containing protein, partial [Anaerolineales bacterium]|nr:Fe-S-binding domain-containing protein [Anaerolineales bacterium]
MDFIQDNLLNLIVFFPLLSALIVFVLPEDEKNLIRRLALVLSLVPLVLVLIMWFTYNAQYRFAGGFAFEVQAEWFPAIGASYHMGIDGISLTMFLLTTILTPIAILASFDIDDKVRMYMTLFLVMETAMLGLFASLDLMIFFIFWEFGLVPMYFLIKIWGGKDRDYA